MWRSISAEDEPSDDDGSNKLEVDETEVAGEAVGRGRGRVEEYCVMESRRTEGNGRDDEEDEEEANGVIGTERVVTEPFRDRLR